ncbi:MAG: pyridoxine 5'-phosphate synthase [bacterium]|nr:pyridoxine 5'-phosphate synthase [bacterium]
MIPRIGLDLEAGLHIARAVPDLDLLDVAYGAVHGGAQVLMLPMAAFVSSAYTPDLFKRPGLPLLVVKTEVDDLDRVTGLGRAPDRVLVVGERGRTVQDWSRVAAFAARTGGEDFELAALIEPEVSALKELIRLHAHWAYFSTESVVAASTSQAAEAELARLTSACLAAAKVNLRVALWGPTGRHLPQAFAALPNVEEIYPVPDLWAMALRLGWERAIEELRRLMQ